MKAFPPLVGKGEGFVEGIFVVSYDTGRIIYEGVPHFNRSGGVTCRPTKESILKFLCLDYGPWAMSLTISCGP